jgi:putative membrane protein
MLEHGWQRLAAAAMCASLVGVAGCGKGNGDATDSASGDVARDSAATAPGVAPGTTATAPASSTPGSTASNTMAITGGDPEILQVLAVVDQGEIQDGQLAQRQARNAQVKTFARELVSSHTKSLQKTRQLAKTNNVQLMSDSGTSANRAGATDTSNKSAASTPSSAAGTAGSGIATQLKTMHTQTMEQLRSQQGAAFDSAFVNAQVMGHQQVFDLLQRAQSQAQNSGVQQHLTASMKDVQSHLERAQQLQQRLASGATSDSATKGKTDTGRTKADTGRAKGDTTRRP